MFATKRTEYGLYPVETNEENEALQIVTSKKHKPRCPHCDSPECLQKRVGLFGLNRSFENQPGILFVRQCYREEEYFLFFMFYGSETRKGLECTSCRSKKVVFAPTYIIKESELSKASKYFVRVTRGEGFIQYIEGKKVITSLNCQRCGFKACLVLKIDERGSIHLMYESPFVGTESIIEEDFISNGIVEEVKWEDLWND